MPSWVCCALAASTGVLDGRDGSSHCSLRMPMAAFGSRCWNPGNHEEGLWCSWNNSHEDHNFGGKKLCLAISYSGRSSWFFLLLLEVESMGFSLGSSWFAQEQLDGLCFPLAWEKRLSLPLAVTQSPGWFRGPGVASPAIAPFVLHLIKFSVGSGSVKQFGDVIPLICQQAPPGLC